MKKALFPIFFISALLFACSQNNELTPDNDADDTPLQHVTSSNQGENPGKDNGDKTDADNDSDDENYAENNGDKADADNDSDDKNDSENNDDKVDADNDSDDENNDGQKCVWLQVNYTYRFGSNTSTSTSYSNNSRNWIYYNGLHDWKTIDEYQQEVESNSGKSVSTQTSTTAMVDSGKTLSITTVRTDIAYDLYGNEIPSSSCQLESETITTYFEETLPTQIVKNSYSNSVLYYNDGREFESNTATDYTLEYLGTENDCNVYKVTRNDDGFYYEYKIKDDMIIEMNTYMNSILSTHTEYSIPDDEFLAGLGIVDFCTYDGNGNPISTSKYVLINKTENEAMIDLVTTSSSGEGVQSNKYKRFSYPFEN